MHEPDDELVERARGGDFEALAEIVERHRPALLKHCAPLAPPGRAEDAVQQAALEACLVLRGAPAGQPGDPLAALERDAREALTRDLIPWLYALAAEAAADLRRESGWQHERLGDDVSALGSVEETAERDERVDELMHALAALPLRQRQALVMREVSGRGHLEIAEELHVSKAAVRQLIHRARERVRSGLAVLLPPELLRFLAGSGGVAGEASQGAVAASFAGPVATAGATALAVGALLVAGGGDGDSARGERPVARAGAQAAATHAPAPVRRRAAPRARRLPAAKVVLPASGSSPTTRAPAATSPAVPELVAPPRPPAPERGGGEHHAGAPTGGDGGSKPLPASAGDGAPPPVTETVEAPAAEQPTDGTQPESAPTSDQPSTSGPSENSGSTPPGESSGPSDSSGPSSDARLLTAEPCISSGTGSDCR